MIFSKKYVPKSLSRRDKTKQRKELIKSKKNYKTKKGKQKYYTRGKLKSYKNKSSSWTKQFHKLYPDAKSYSEISKATGIPSGALKAVVRKGKGAYFSSGSRPNQTATSWGRARMYSYILGGKTRKVDKHITIKYNVKFKHRTK
jgi:hypothetical protein|tara:strand:+ start:70 stop:501 length:432 start_codon:yes stop_codon:yes gene_type:complete